MQMKEIMSDKTKLELREVQEKYDNKELYFQEFKDKSLAIIIAHSTVEGFEDIVSYILEN